MSDVQYYEEMRLELMSKIKKLGQCRERERARTFLAETERRLANAREAERVR